MRIALVVADFYPELAREMLEAAKEGLGELGATPARIVRVSGCLEMPLFINELLEQQEIDAVVCLGAIIQGETSHDVMIAEALYQRAAELSVKHGKPVAMGVSGPRQTRAMAEARTRLFARRAIEAAVKSLEELGKLREE